MLAPQAPFLPSPLYSPCPSLGFRIKVRGECLEKCWLLTGVTKMAQLVKALATKPDDLIHGNYMVGEKLLPNCPPYACNGTCMLPHINKCKSNHHHHHHHLACPTSLVQPWGVVTGPCFCRMSTVSHVLGSSTRSFSWSSLPSSLLLLIILYPCAFVFRPTMMEATSVLTLRAFVSVWWGWAQGFVQPYARYLLCSELWGLGHR